MAATQTPEQRAALLLMSLDSKAASELLKGLSASQVESLSLAIARLAADDKKLGRNRAQVVREFCKSLEVGQNAGLNLRTFFSETLQHVVGEKKARDIESKVQVIIEKKNPFDFMSSATVDELALALAGECPQTISVVLSELPPKKAAELLPLLDKDMCFKAVWDMAMPKKMNSKIKEKMAAIISERLKGVKGETIVRENKENLRNIAIMLSDTERNLRNEAIDKLKEQAANLE